MIARELWPILSQLAATYGLMLVIPGPNVVTVVRCSLDRSPPAPILAALGVASGATLAAAIAAWSAAAITQSELIRAVGSLFIAFVLLRIAVRLATGWPASKRPQDRPTGNAGVEPFVSGLGTALLNPVSMPFFAAFWLSHGCTQRSIVVACCTVFLMAATWFGSLGLVAARLQCLTVPPWSRRIANATAACTLVVIALRYVRMAALG